MYYRNCEKDLKEILNGRECAELDFSNPKHAEFFLKSHGGEELLRTKFTGIYDAFCMARKLHSECRKNEFSAQEANSAKPYSCWVDVPYISTGLQNSREQNGETGKLTAAACANVALDQIGAVYMDGWVKEIGKPNHYATIWEDFGYKALKEVKGRCIGKGEGMVPNPNQKEFSTTCSFDYYDKNGKLLISVVTNVESTGSESTIQPIETFTVSAPKSKHNKPVIVVSYKDRPQFDPDYPYYDVEPVNGEVKVLLPIEAEICFKKDYKPVEFCKKRSRPISLAYQEDLTVTYGYTMAEIAKKFVIDGQKVTFKLEKDWLTTFSYEKFKTGVTAFLDCPFRFTVYGPDTEGNNKNHDVPLSMTSNSDLPEGEKYYESTGRDVYVPPIEFHWGCFGKDTKIQMEDGSHKKITEIKEGERVAVYEGEAREVLRLTGGTEKKLVHIETENGKHIALTDTHPILTARGIVMACQVNPIDRMVMADGTQSPVRFVYTEDYNDNIYNLDLGMEAAHMIFADGFIAGDLGSQNNAIRRQEEEERPIAEAKELYAEVSRLREYLKASRQSDS